MKPVNLKSLRTGFAELVLIFVGITLALAFENWNEAQKQRSQEHQILAELERDLTETLVDAERDIEGAREQVALLTRMLERFDDPSIEIGSDDLWLLFAGHVLFAKRAAYESIKSIGLDLVGDDALRSAISGFYELTLVRVAHHDEFLFQLREDQNAHVLLPHLNAPVVALGAQVETQVGPSTMAVPELELLDPESFFADPAMKLHLVRRYNAESATLAGYRMAEAECRTLLQLIRSELQ